MIWNSNSTTTIHTKSVDHVKNTSSKQIDCGKNSITQQPSNKKSDFQRNHFIPNNISKISLIARLPYDKLW